MAERRATKKVGKLDESITALSSEVGALREDIRALTSLLGRAVFPQEAMDDLTGELRALRYLMDGGGKYAFMDTIREKKRIDRKRAGRRPPGGGR